MVECLLFARNSATGTVKAAFFTIILFTAFRYIYNCITQSTVQPVPTRHRRHACIIMRTAFPANTKTWPNVVSMLASAVGGGPIVKQHWVKSTCLLGSTQVSVYTHPSPTIIFSPADQGTFSKTAGQSQAYYNTWNWEQGTLWRQPSAHFNMRSSSVQGGQCITVCDD